MLTVLNDEGYSKVQLKAEREAFLYSFLCLDDFKKENEEEQAVMAEAKKKKLLKIQRMKKKDSKKA